MTTCQDRFAAALLDANLPPPIDFQDTGRRFDVYRNNVVVSLTEALITGFPVITRLLGEPNMKHVAGLFLRAFPPSSPVLLHYGAEFPEFLSQMEQVSHLGYLADVARLELAIRRSYHAADAIPVAPDQLAMSPDQLIGARMKLAPSAHLLRSDWPVHGIWQFNTKTGAPKPQMRAEDVLVLRPEYDPEPHLLPNGGATWILALMHGAALGAAQDAAEAEVPGFDASPVLALILDSNALIDVIRPKGAAA